MKTKQLKLIVFISLCLSLLSIAQSINLPPFPSAGDVPIQAHSFNDVNYIYQLLKRGVRYYKIDVSMANRESCTKHSTWNTSQKCYKTDQYSEQICCLALRGDTSSRDSFDYSFSTIDEFISMLQSYLSKHSINRMLLFAINHQFGFEFANEMVQNSTYKLAKLMEKYPQLYIGFGSDNFIFQYDRVCRLSLQQTKQQNQLNQKNQIDQYQQIQAQPLLKLNAQACTPQRKYISSSRFFLQSGDDSPIDTRDIHSRYRNFNVYYKSIEQRCNNGFPSWIKKYPNFPLIFWQPSNQRQILYVIELFMSQKCRYHHGRDLSGLAITSNIDPEVFQFYLKRMNESISQKQMVFYPNNQKVALKYGDNFVTKLNDSNYLILGQQDQSSNDTKKGSTLQLIQFKIDSAGEKVSQTMRKQLAPAQKTIKIVGGLQNMIVIQKALQSASDSTQVKVTLLNGNLQQVTSINIDKHVDTVYFRNFYYVIVKTNGSPLVFNLYRTYNFTSFTTIMSFSLISEKAKSIESFVAFQIDDKMRYLISGSINNTVWLAQIGNQVVSRSGIIGNGDKSKLVLKENGMILLSIQNGACNSGVQINNGDTPLCQTYKHPQFKPLTSTKNTITFVQFTYRNMGDRFQSNSTNEPITPCTQNFVQYKALNGRKVQVVDLWSRLWIVSEYVHISQQGLLNSLFCAGSNYEFPKNNTKGLLGTIWSRMNLGNTQNQRQLQI